MKSKRGGVGEVVSMFVAVVGIVLILTVFIFMAGFMRAVEESKGGLEIHKESQVGLSNVFNYMWTNYRKLIETRVFIYRGFPAESSLLEVKYYDK